MYKQGIAYERERIIKELEERGFEMQLDHRVITIPEKNGVPNF